MNITQKRKWEKEGYFTVEAAVMIPLALGFFVVLIYIMFFQYNRCLLEQEMGILALRGAAGWDKENAEVVKTLQRQAEHIYWDKYIALHRGGVNIKHERGKITVSCKSEMKIPFMGKSTLQEAVYQNRVINPVLFVRTYRRLTEKEEGM